MKSTDISSDVLDVSNNFAFDFENSGIAVNGKIRLLTPMETERIQGFLDNWTDTGMPEKMRYFCMGNALVVPMIEKMEKTISKIFSEE